MKIKNSLLIIFLMAVQTAFGAVAMAETSYPLTYSGTGITTRYVEFTESDGNVIAATSVLDVAADTDIALILTEYVNEVVVSTKVDRKTVSAGSEFSAVMKKNDGSVYRAYVWNYTSLTPYTNVAEYPSNDVSLEKLFLGDRELDTDVKEYTFNTLTNEQLPFVTGVSVNNGTKVTVKVSSATMPGTITILIESSDGTATDKIVINYNDMTPELKTWLENAGIDLDDGFTTYVIEDINQ